MNVYRVPLLALLIFNSWLAPLADGSCSPPSLPAELCRIDFTYKELVSLFHGFLYVSVIYLPSPLLCGQGLLSCGRWCLCWRHRQLSLLELGRVLGTRWLHPWSTWVWKLLLGVLAAPARPSASQRPGFACFQETERLLLTSIVNSCRGVGTQEIEGSSSVWRSFRPFLSHPRPVPVATKYLLNFVRECASKRSETERLGKIAHGGHCVNAKGPFCIVWQTGLYQKKKSWAQVPLSPK